MSISLMPLPYSLGALEPHISRETLEFHYGKHHRGYVDKVNRAIDGTKIANADLEEIIKAAKGMGDQSLFNSSAQAWNHGFYWHSLAPEKSEPSQGLADAITSNFGSMAEFEERFAEEATGHFGSGWAWLVADQEGGLDVCSTHDAATFVTKSVKPLLTIDVWEHAYYIDVRNDRSAYVQAVIENLINWEFASANYERGSHWIYMAREFVEQDP